MKRLLKAGPIPKKWLLLSFPWEFGKQFKVGLIELNDSNPATVVAGGIVPFFIDWGDSPHPAASVPLWPVLESLRAERPEPTIGMRALSGVGIGLPAEFGHRPALIATLRTERGLVELR